MGPFLTSEGILALVTLTFLEIILGVDNVIFISILSGKLPRGQQAKARRSGLLAAMVMRIALLLSIVPESYSLALSECLAAGVPVAAFDHGAIAERLRRHGGGLLVEPEAGAAGIAAAVAARINGLRIPGETRTDDPLPADGAEGGAAQAFADLYRELGLC